MTSHHLRRAVPLFPALLCIAACGPAPGPDTALPEGEILATEPLSREIEAFAGGHVKIAWSRYLGPRNDVFANSDDLQLWGIDTRDGQGVRPILEEKGNYARPLISPSGDDILFTRKGTHRKDESTARYFRPAIYRVGWDGQEPRRVAEGHAVDVWRDPADGTEWVYATDLLPAERASMMASRLERFPLEDPSRREVVWDRSELSTENIQVSRDAARASALFPWPDAGVIDFDKMEHQRYQRGCWPSLAPDDSYLAWVFDGAHKNLHLFTDKADDTWVVPVNHAPGIDGHEVYHPRWSNHIRFIAMTGPYTGASISRSQPDGIEVYLGRFDQTLREIESWLQVTDDDKGDFFPVLWIGHEAGGATVVPQRPSPAAANDAPEWPGAALPALFSWEDGEARARAGLSGERESSVSARERARFGPRHEMLVDGGYFLADEASAASVAEHLATDGKPFTLELMATAASGEQEGVVMGSERFQLQQRRGSWVFLAESSEPVWMGPVTPGQPQHLVLVSSGEGRRAYLNGEEAAAGPAPGAGGPSRLAAPAGLAFGGGWDGAIEAVSFSPAAREADSIAASWDYLEEKIASRPAIPRVRLRGKLLEMTEERPVEALDTYQRGLLAYVYEVEEVLQGEWEGEKVVVTHWTIMDREPLSGFPRQLGESYELLLEPYSAHRELVSERQWNDLLEISEPYHDVATPQP